MACRKKLGITLQHCGVQGNMGGQGWKAQSLLTCLVITLESRWAVLSTSVVRTTAE